MLQLDRRDEAIVRFRRATSVLPADSSWWRSSTWRLASALDASAQNAEAIELYYKSYRSGPPDPIKYAVIESLYRRINGKSDGLVAKIGLNPLTVTVKEPEATTEESKSTVESAPAILPATATKLPELLPAKVDVTPTPLQVGSPENTKASEPTRTSSEVAVEKTEPSQPLISKPIDTILPDKPKELFPPVVITIAPSESKRDDVTGIKPCVLTSSEDLLSIQNSGNEIAVIIGTESDEDLTEMTGVSSSVADLAVRREEIAAVKTKAIFVVRSIAPAKGSFRVIFTLPCGKKEVSVKIS